MGEIKKAMAEVIDTIPSHMVRYATLEALAEAIETEFNKAEKGWTTHEGDLERLGIRLVELENEDKKLKYQIGESAEVIVGLRKRVRELEGNATNDRRVVDELVGKIRKLESPPEPERVVARDKRRTYHSGQVPQAGDSLVHTDNDFAAIVRYVNRHGNLDGWASDGTVFEDWVPSFWKLVWRKPEDC